MATNGLSLLMNKPSIPEIMEDEEKAKFEQTLAQAEALKIPSMYQGAGRSPAAAAAPIVVKTPIDEKITTKVTESALPQESFNQLAEVFSGSKKQVSQLASDATKTLTQIYRDMSELESAEKSKSAAKIQAAVEKLEKGSDKEMTSGQMFARLLIGLAPQLIGAVAGKAMGIGYGAGGAAGGAGALAGLQQLKEQEKEAKERGDKVAQTKLKVLIEQEEARLKPYTEATQQSLKNLLDVPVLEMKTEASLAAQGVPLAARAIIEGAEREKTTVQEREGEKSTVVKPSAPKKADKGAGAPKEPTQAQLEAAGSARRGQLALQAIEKLETSGFDRTSLKEAARSRLPNVLKSDALTEYEQAERNFIMAVVRDESGAAVKESEFEKYASIYFPRAGDSKETIAQKKLLRAQKVAEFEGKAGETALSRVPLQALGAISEASKMTKQDYEKMSASEAKAYMSASPAERKELLKKVRAR